MHQRRSAGAAGPAPNHGPAQKEKRGVLELQGVTLEDTATASESGGEPNSTLAGRLRKPVFTQDCRLLRATRGVKRRDCDNVGNSPSKVGADGLGVRMSPFVADEIAPLATAFAGGEYATADLELLIGRAYLALVKEARPCMADILALGIDKTTAEAIITVLARRRFLDRAADGTITLAAPDLALRDHAMRLERHASDLMSLTAEVSQLYANARADLDGSPSDKLRLLYTVPDISMAAAEVIASSEGELLTMRAPTLRVFDLAQATAQTQESLGRNARGKRLPMRAIYDIRLLQLPNALDIVASRRSLEEQRAMPNLPFAVTIGDRSAVVDMSFPGRTGAIGFYCDAPELAGPIREVAQRFWEMSTRISRTGSANELDDREHRVLTLLVTVMSDVAIARQLGVSQRTVERRISALMERLGASSRFQAGLLARDRGWI